LGASELYFDNNATTPLDEEVLGAVTQALAENYGNPASRHPRGEAALRAVEEARAAVARLVGARTPDEIVFTSGGTESIHTALFFALARHGGGLVLTSAVEHPAVLRPLERWQERGFEVRQIGVDPEGRLSIDELLDTLAGGRDVRLVSLLLANNETGVLLTNDELARIASAARRVGALVHLDAIQAPGKHPLENALRNADFASLSAHKFHGPKGVGALFVRTGLEHPRPGLLIGGPQEDERRAGTSNVPGIVGMGRAAERAHDFVQGAGIARLAALRDRLEREIVAGVRHTRVHGESAPRLPNTTNIGFPGVDGELLHLSLAAEGLCVSGGSACSSRSQRPSPVLLAMGVGEKEARATVRFSLSRRTTPEEIDQAVEVVLRVVGQLAGLSASAAEPS